MTTRGTTSGIHGSRPPRRGGRRWITGVATAATLLLTALTTLTACEGPCMRHSDCPSPWVCNPYGVCEPETTATDPAPDAADDRVHDLPDGALDDSDLADPADAGVPDAGS